MNVVIFGKGFGKPRQLSLTGPVVGLGIAAVVGVLVSAGIAGGYWYSSKTGSGVSEGDPVVSGDFAAIRDLEDGDPVKIKDALKATDTRALEEIYKQIDELEKTEAETRTAWLPTPLYRWPLGVALISLLALGLFPEGRKRFAMRQASG